MVLRRTMIFFGFWFLVILPVSLYPQTAEKLEAILRTDAVSYQQAAQFVLEAADGLSTPGPAEAFRYASGQKWLPANVSGGDTARLDGLSLLLMRSFGLKGGMFYSLCKNSHYAYRELVFQDIIQGRADPAMTVSGDELLFLVNRVLTMKEGF
jgi:hypothetical protein